MIRQFWMMTALLLLFVVGVGVHYLRFDPDKVGRSLNALASLTQRTEVSLGRAYYESADAYGNSAYPEMQTIDRMDFVYEK